MRMREGNSTRPRTDSSFVCDCTYLDAAPCHDGQNIKRTRPLTTSPASTDGSIACDGHIAIYSHTMPQLYSHRAQAHWQIHASTDPCIIVSIAMLLRAMLPKKSSACAHSPPTSQELTAALYVIVYIWMLLRAMTAKTSSARDHSRPLPQALSVGCLLINNNLDGSE